MHKKAQISLEYIILFSFALLIFIVVGSFFIINVDKLQSINNDAQRLSDSIKLEIISASLSQMDYNSTITLPKKLSNKEYTLSIYTNPDNLLIINTTATNQIAKSNLPVINESDVTFSPKDKIIITKSNNLIKIKREAASP